MQQVQGEVAKAYEKVEGQVYCLEHGAIHDDTTDPYEYGHPDCHRAEHRLVYWRSRKGDLP